MPPTHSPLPLLLVQRARQPHIFHTALVTPLSIHVHSNQVLLVSRRFLCFIVFSVPLLLRSPKVKRFLPPVGDGVCLIEVGLTVSRFVRSCLSLFCAPVNTHGSVSQLSVR